MQKALSFKVAAIISVKGNGYKIQFWYTSKDEAINLLKNADLRGKVEHKIQVFFIIRKYI